MFQHKLRLIEILITIIILISYRIIDSVKINAMIKLENNNE